jgi:hypothetical protein
LHLLGFVEIKNKFQRNMSPPYSGRRMNQARNEREAGGLLLIFSSTLNIESPCSSETSVDFEWSTRRCVPEGGTLEEWQRRRQESFPLPMQLLNAVRNIDNSPAAYWWAEITAAMG